MSEQLIDFLKSELKISAEAISLARKTASIEPHILPIVLWQYGLLDKKQLDFVFDWLEIA